MSEPMIDLRHEFILCTSCAKEEEHCAYAWCGAPRNHSLHSSARLEQAPKAERSELPPREAFALLPAAEVEELKSQLRDARQREQEMRGKLEQARWGFITGKYKEPLDILDEILAAIPPKEEPNGK